MSSPSPSQPALHRNAVPVLAAASAQGVELDLREFPEGTRTAEEAAAAVGVAVGQIVKSLVFGVGTSQKAGDGRIVMALVSGANQLDERKLASAAGCAKAWRVDADAVRAATGFPVGGVAPFGHPAPLSTWIDEDLLRHDVVWAAAGTPSLVFPIEPNHVVALTSAVIADLAKRAI